MIYIHCNWIVCALCSIIDWFAFNRHHHFTSHALAHGNLLQHACYVMFVLQKQCVCGACVMAECRCSAHADVMCQMLVFKDRLVKHDSGHG